METAKNALTAIALNTNVQAQIAMTYQIQFAKSKTQPSAQTEFAKSASTATAEKSIAKPKNARFHLNPNARTKIPQHA